MTAMHAAEQEQQQPLGLCHVQPVACTPTHHQAPQHHADTDNHTVAHPVCNTSVSTAYVQHCLCCRTGCQHTVYCTQSFTAHTPCWQGKQILALVPTRHFGYFSVCTQLAFQSCLQTFPHVYTKAAHQRNLAAAACKCH